VAFFRPLNCTATKWNPDLPWPISGLFYVSAFMGPISAGPLVGVITRDWLAAGVGLLSGIAIALLHAALSDRFVDPWIAGFQLPLGRGLSKVLVNIAAFAWAFVLCALAMLAPIAVLGSQILEKLP
jgi:ABC-type uncharacterized transport system permease subunit